MSKSFMFFAGIVTGAAATYLYMKKKFEEKVWIEVKNKMTKLRSQTVDSIADDQNNYDEIELDTVNVTKINDTDDENDEIFARKVWKDVKKKLYEDKEPTKEEYEMIKKHKANPNPYIITEREYENTKPGYDKIELNLNNATERLFYADTGECFEDISGTIGGDIYDDILDNEDENDVFFVRCEVDATDYKIRVDAYED